MGVEKSVDECVVRMIQFMYEDWVVSRDYEFYFVDKVVREMLEF